MKKLLWCVFCIGLAAVMMIQPITAAEKIAPFDVNARSAVLMDWNTGTVLYEKNKDKAMPPASVTKVMTLLLIMEAIEGGNVSLEDQVTVSAYAASMGGSQVFLEAGETMTVEELLKCVIISSANDAAVTLAEKIYGSEEAFVARMNERAAELGMNNTHFENVTGLDDDTSNHMTSAYDIALMSRELLNHPKILEYSGIWMDTIRNGTFGLTNTNRLIRFYSGATGLKTGSTAKAGFCISATAKRENLHLIAVIMGSDTRDTRNASAQSLLDWGFANYSVYSHPGGEAGNAVVIGGTEDTCSGVLTPYTILLPKGKQKDVAVEYILHEKVPAPVHSGDVIGSARFYLGEQLLSEIPIVSEEEIPEIGFFELFGRMFGIYLLK